MNLLILLLPLYSFAGVIFGDDDRVERYDIVDPQIREISRSSVALIPKKNLLIQDDNVEILRDSLQDVLGFCEDSNFSHQPQLANCSAALIGPDLVLTAAHCLNDKMNFGCKDYNVVFDYVEEADGSISLSPENIYNCKEVIHHDFDDRFSSTFLDLAIIKLDRKVKDRKPLKMEFRSPSIGEELYLLGYPLGIAQKLADNGERTRRKDSPNSFSHNLDSFSVNSGSPVFSAKTNKIIGVHVRGTGGNFQNVGNCRDWNVGTDTDFSEANDLRSIRKIIKKLNLPQ